MRWFDDPQAVFFLKKLTIFLFRFDFGLNKTKMRCLVVFLLFKNKLKGRGRYIYSDLNLIIQGDFSKFLT